MDELLDSQGMAWQSEPMTKYGIDVGAGTLVAVWPSGRRSTASVVARLESAMGAERLNLLSEELGDLSSALWNVYLEPVSSASNEEDRWRREAERECLDQVATYVVSPNLPDERTGTLLVSYSPVKEAANRVGRVLHELGNPSLLDAVVAEVCVEADAVKRADLGDLSGRAGQAAALSKVEASPVQVVAADRLLEEDPLGRVLLNAPVEPAAACVAAAHWLAAAAEAAAERSRNDPVAIFREADDIQAVSVDVPELVVRRILNEEHGPEAVVRDLLSVAVAASHGLIADLPSLMEQMAHMEESLAKLPADQRDAIRADAPLRATILDPRRPARDLLEHLLDGIASCRLVYVEDSDFDPDEQVEARSSRIEQEFLCAVRSLASRHSKRLT